MRSDPYLCHLKDVHFDAGKVPDYSDIHVQQLYLLRYAYGFLLRHDFCEVPPRVEYTLTELGESFLPVLDYIKAWGDKNIHT